MHVTVPPSPVTTAEGRPFVFDGFEVLGTDGSYRWLYELHFENRQLS